MNAPASHALVLLIIAVAILGKLGGSMVAGLRHRNELEGKLPAIGILMNQRWFFPRRPLSET
jgi:hypothetical protein